MRWLLLVLALVALWLYSRTFPPPHPCEIWQATDPGLDLETCYEAFEVPPDGVETPASGE